MTRKLPERVRGKVLFPGAYMVFDRTGWLRARSTGIGASESAAVLGLHPWLSARQLQESKRAEVVDKPPSEAAQWGRLLEPVIVEGALRKFPHLGYVYPSTGLLRSEDSPVVLATPDRLLGKSATELDSLLEVKSYDPLLYQQQWSAHKVPPHILMQVQQQLEVTQLDGAWIAVLIGGAFMPSPTWVARDWMFGKWLQEVLTWWWETYVLPEDAPPAPDFPEVRTPTISAMYTALGVYR